MKESEAIELRGILDEVIASESLTYSKAAQLLRSYSDTDSDAVLRSLGQGCLDRIKQLEQTKLALWQYISNEPNL